MRDEPRLAPRGSTIRGARARTRSRAAAAVPWSRTLDRVSEGYPRPEHATATRAANARCPRVTVRKTSSCIEWFSAFRSTRGSRPRLVARALARATRPSRRFFGSRAGSADHLRVTLATLSRHVARSARVRPHEPVNGPQRARASPESPELKSNTNPNVPVLCIGFVNARDARADPNADDEEIIVRTI